MGELKPGWRRVKFGEVVRLGKARCAPAAEGIERYIGLEHIEPGDLRVRSWGEVSDGTTFTTRVRPGHVLFGKRRAYQRKVAVADFDAVCSGDIYVLESANPAKLLPDLLPFLCQTDAFFDHAVGTSAGSLSPRTNWTSLAEYQFALPPLQEQRRHLGALLALSEAEEAVSALLTAHLRVSGALQTALFSDEHLGHSPAQRLAGCCSRMGVGIASSVAHAYRPTGIPIIRNTNIHPNRIEMSDLLFVDPDFDRSYATKRVRAGDLVITRTATDVPGVAAVVPAELDGSQTFTTLICSPQAGRLDPHFLSAWINGPHGRSFMRSHKVGGLQQNLNVSLLEELPVRVPSLATQRAIAGRITELEAGGEAILNRQSALRGLRQRALNAMSAGRE